MPQQLHHCGACGSVNLGFDGLKEHRCGDCGWIYFGNPAAAAAALLWYNGELLMVRRGREPGIGLLDLPGGFIDPDESAEQALSRELHEELRLNLSEFSYFGSFSNRYRYAAIEYTVVDMVFSAILIEKPTWHDSEELDGICWRDPRTLSDTEIAFPSVRNCLIELNTSLRS